MSCEHCRSETRVLVERAERLGTVHTDPNWPQRGASDQIAMRRKKDGDDVPLCDECKGRLHRAIMMKQAAERRGIRIRY